MYKIMTKLHTQADKIYAFHMVTNDKDEIVEYASMSKDEAADEALKLLGRVGYEDLRVVDDLSYYLDFIYGRRPSDIPETYILEYVNIEGYTPDIEKIEGIEEGATVISDITFAKAVSQFHLIVDEKEYKLGNPAWIKYEIVSDKEVKIIYSGITRDHTVEIKIDKYKDDEPILSI